MSGAVDRGGRIHRVGAVSFDFSSGSIGGFVLRGKCELKATMKGGTANIDIGKERARRVWSRARRLPLPDIIDTQVFGCMRR